MSNNELTLSEDKKRTIALKITTYVVSILLTIMILTPLYYMLKSTFGEEVKIVHGAGDNTQIVITPREHSITLKEYSTATRQEQQELKTTRKTFDEVRPAMQ